MIGNTIKYREYFTYGGETKFNIKEGVVVDAYTKIDGSMSGKGAAILGFGESSMRGKTDSTRMYKIEISYINQKDERVVFYQDIPASRLHEIVSYANQPQEQNEEKFSEF